MKKSAFTVFPREGLQFLRSLKRHNNREWFLRHKSNYEQHVKQPMADLILALAEDFQHFAPEMAASPKVSAYRIHRDTRFSKDKSPYKTHVAAVFPHSALGKHDGAGFYVHIAPSEVLIGGGLYMPLPEELTLIRRQIADAPDDFLAIIENRSFKRLFGSVAGEQLSRAPRGFPQDHPAAKYLKYKSFLASRTFEPEVSTRTGFYKLVVESFKGMVPFARYFNTPIIQSRRTRERQEALLSF
jgi:uncharacterized protein (TIGR02453 family)